MRTLMLALTATLCASVASLAQDQVAPSAPPASERAPEPGAAKTQDRVDSIVLPAPLSSRFNFVRVDDAFVRLDNQTGQVAYCASSGSGWLCRAVAEDGAALEKAIAHLQSEVAALKKELAALRQPPPVPVPVPPPAGKNDEFSRNLHHDFARARDYLQWTWRQVIGMIAKFQKDVTGNG